LEQHRTKQLRQDLQNPVVAIVKDTNLKIKSAKKWEQKRILPSSMRRNTFWEQQCVETFNEHHGASEDLTKDIPITRTEQCQQRP
jgi:hypothetical protein